jgi:tetratricopeptide (TPR) repeat protein
VLWSVFFDLTVGGKLLPPHAVKTRIGKAEVFRDAEEIFGAGVEQHRAGRIEQALALYQRVLAANPNHADAHNNLGVVLAALDRTDAAVAHYERAIVLKPGYAEAHNNLALTLDRLGKIHAALTHYQRALSLNPSYAEAYNNLGLTLAAHGKMAAAALHYERAIALKPLYAEAHNNLGIALTALGRIDAALEHYARAVTLKPDYAEAHNNLGVALTTLGRLDEALVHYNEAIRCRPAYAEAHFNRAEIRTFRKSDLELAALEALAQRDGLPADKAPPIFFALGKACEDIGDYPRAFAYLRKGNERKRSQIAYDEPATLKLFQRISSVFTGRLLERFRGAGDPSLVPVFVVGMPRSGSTLIEQILAGHPQILGAGELKDLERATAKVLNASSRPLQYPECVPDLDGAMLRQIGRAYLDALPAAGANRVRIVDKLPGNFFHIGLIRLILPNARIIHVVRHPLDTCVSCYSKLFASGQHFSYDLGELGRYYRAYSKLMAYWREILPADSMLEVAYEDVVNDLEGSARRLVAYCGLAWDSACLSFHRTARPVKTASAAQVRMPLFRSSLDRWRKYEREIEPLCRELRNCESAAVWSRGTAEPRFPLRKRRPGYSGLSDCGGGEHHHQIPHHQATVPIADPADELVFLQV